MTGKTIDLRPYKILSSDNKEQKNEKDQIRATLLEAWIKTMINCRKGVGHSWTKPPVYDDTMKLWIWGPCDECGKIRVTTPFLNDIWIHPSKMTYETLIATDDFGNPQKIVDYVLQKIVDGILSENQ